MSNQNYLEIVVPIRLDTKWHQSLVKELSAVQTKIEWLGEGTHHQTLVFINDGSLVDQLKTKFSKIRIKPITLTIDKLEAFTTGAGDKHVVCLTSSKLPAELQNLAENARKLADSLEANYDKRPLKLHITLCKIPSGTVSLEDVKSILAKIQLPVFNCCLREIQYRYKGGGLIWKYNCPLNYNPHSPTSDGQEVGLCGL